MFLTLICGYMTAFLKWRHNFKNSAKINICVARWHLVTITFTLKPIKFYKRWKKMDLLFVIYILHYFCYTFPSVDTSLPIFFTRRHVYSWESTRHTHKIWLIEIYRLHYISLHSDRMYFSEECEKENTRKRKSFSSSVTYIAVLKP